MEKKEKGERKKKEKLRARLISNPMNPNLKWKALFILAGGKKRGKRKEEGKEQKRSTR